MNAQCKFTHNLSTELNKLHDDTLSISNALSPETGLARFVAFAAGMAEKHAVLCELWPSIHPSIHLTATNCAAAAASLSEYECHSPSLPPHFLCQLRPSVGRRRCLFSDFAVDLVECRSGKLLAVHWNTSLLKKSIRGYSVGRLPATLFRVAAESRKQVELVGLHSE